MLAPKTLIISTRGQADLTAVKEIYDDAGVAAALSVIEGN